MPLASLIAAPPRRRAMLSLLAVAATTASVLSVATAVAPPARAATAFTPDDVVVERVGAIGGGSALSSAATPTFLDEFSPTGTAVQTVALPTTTSGANKALTNSGSASSEGSLSLSPNGRFLTTAGYNAVTGTASVASTSATSTSRTVAIVGTDGAVDTSTSVSDAFGANNVRAATTVDGSGVWVVGATSGVRYAVRGAATSTQVSDPTGSTNLRYVTVAGGQLHVTSSSGTTRVATVGTGTPTSGPQPVTNLPGAIGSVNSPYQVAFLTLGSGTAPDTAYVADNGTGAVQKYSLVGTGWNLTGSVSGLTGVTGVAANVYSGAVRLYATTSSGLYRFGDTSGKGGTLTGAPGAPIATAATNTAFRGVAFAPGTTINSGAGTPPPTVGAPTVGVAQPALAAALGDPTNPGLGATVAVGTNATYGAGQLTVSASSSNTSVAPSNGIRVTGTGANRTVTVTPAAVGTSTVTLTVTAPDGQTGTAAFTYGVSADQGDATDRYLAGAGNASAAVDVGGGYALVGDDESDVIRLYDTANSGLPVATFDFTSQLPFGTAEVDIEGAARAGDTVYWMGSMSTNSSGDVAPARSTMFATTVSGTGASTTLTYVGANTTLQTDLVNWDRTNGHGLGADYFGFDRSVNGGVANHAVNSFNLEGLEFAKGSTTTAYLAFRAPIVPASNRTRALLVPVTNFTQLVTGTAAHGSFGAPLQWDLGGLGVRDLKANADGTYVVLAGTADGTNSSFVLYTWDGDPNDPPVPGQSLPLVPAGPNQGAWEAIVSVPSPLTAGSSLELLEDDGDLAWYGNGLTSKSGLSVPLQKDLLRTVAYAAATPFTTTTTLAAAPNPASVDQAVTYTATVTSPAGTPRGTVAFAEGSTAISGCAARPLAADGTASCTTAYGAAGTHQVTASYAGAASYAASTSGAVTETVDTRPTSTVLTASSNQVVAGDPVTLTATVTSAAGAPAGRVRFATGSGTISGCGQVALDGDGVATCSTSFASPGDRAVTATYLGTAKYSPSTSDSVTVSVAAPVVTTTTTLAVSDASVAIADPVTFTATVAAASGTPTGAVTFTEAGTPVPGCGSVALAADGTAACSTTYAHAGSHRVVAAYSGADTFAGSTSDAVAVTVRRTPVTVTADDQTITFGSADPAFTVTASPAVTFDTAPTCDVSGQHTAVGTYPITCSGGDAGSDFAIGYVDGTLTVARAATSLTVTADPAAPVAGQAVTFTATVGTGGTGTPTGVVAFANGATTPAGCRRVAVDPSGVATCTVAGGFLAGTVTMTATYAGDASYEGSDDSVTVTVGRAASVTTVRVSPTAPLVGDPVTFSAAVTGPSGISPTGSVTFAVDGEGIARCVDVALDGSGRAACTLPDVYPAGGHRVNATYSGDEDLTGSSSTSAFSVVRAASTVTVGVDPVAPVTGQSLTFTAAVTSAGSGPATGSVTFSVTGGAACGPVTLDSSGAATCLLSGGRPAGDSTVTATYSGDAATAPGSAATAFTVGAATTGTTLTSDTAAPVSGQPVTFTAHVAVELPGSGTPTGTMAFGPADGPALPGCDAVAVDASGTAQCTVTAGFAPGSSVVTATYSGDADFTGSGDSLTVTATRAAVTVAVSADPDPPVTGSATTFRVTVAPTAPGAGTPTGAVTFAVTAGANNTKRICRGGNTVALVNGAANCVIAAGKLTTGTAYAVSVAYAGDSRFGSGTGTLAQTAAMVATTTTVTSTLSPSPTGAAVNLQAEVAPVSGTVRPTGTVTFTVTGADGSQVVCTGSNTVTVSAGAATCAITAGRLTASNAPYAVTAGYSGSARNTPSRATFSQQVRPAATKVAVAQSANPTPQGTSATFTATVTPRTVGPVAPTGTVTFDARDKAGHAVTCAGGGPIAVDGTVSCTIAGSDLLAANGPYRVTATYTGDADYARSTVTVTHRVTRPAS